MGMVNMESFPVDKAEVSKVPHADVWRELSSRSAHSLHFPAAIQGTAGRRSRDSRSDGAGWMSGTSLEVGPRPSTPGGVRPKQREDVRPCQSQRPTTPCMNRGGDGVRRGKRVASASGARRPGEALSQVSASLLEDALAMVLAARQQPTPPPELVSRPNAPTPDSRPPVQGSHVWRADQRPLSAAAASRPRHSRLEGPCVKPPLPQWADRCRSPTPTKMLAWEEEDVGTSLPSNAAPSKDDSDQEWPRTGQPDGLIARLIEACQTNNVQCAFSFYERLRHMNVPLYEGVYKLIIECCMRTQQLSRAMQFYETLKTSGQRVSANLALVLIEASAREQQGDTVYAIWRDWCPARPARLERDHIEVMLHTVSALIQSYRPELALAVLNEGAARSPGGALDTFAESLLEELSQHAEALIPDQASTSLGFLELQARLDELRLACYEEPSATALRHRGMGRDAREELLLMEDVDLDLELAVI